MVTTIEKDRTAHHDQLQSIPVDYIVRGQFQPRRTFNEDSLQELAESIKDNGLLQPLVVRKLKPIRYELIAGERRWRAACLAQLDEVLCLVKQCFVRPD